MGALSSHRAGVLKTLIEASPDTIVRDLDEALRGACYGAALTEVHRMVGAERSDRHVRDVVLAPVAPLCLARLSQPAAFSPQGYCRVWRALRRAAPDMAASARACVERLTADGPSPPIFDDLCAMAAVGLRERSTPEFAEAADLFDLQAPGAAEAFSRLLDLAGVARPRLARLREWLNRMTDERAAMLRLTLKDAVAVSPDAGPRLFTIFRAHLDEPWRVLRLIAAVMPRPTDAYLAGSELAEFGEAVLDDVDRRIEALRRLDPDGGIEAGLAAGAAANLAAAQVGEMEQAVALSRDGPWGRRLSRQKKALASEAEACLGRLDRIVSEALPVTPLKIGARTIKGVPNAAAMPDADKTRRAEAMLKFFETVRVSAPCGGYAGARAHAGEAVGERLDAYLEDLLEMAHGGEGDPACARAYLDLIAGFMAMVRDEQAAQIVRRRAAAA